LNSMRCPIVYFRQAVPLSVAVGQHASRGYHADEAARRHDESGHKERAVWPIEVVVVLPLAQFPVEQVDALANRAVFQELVELLVVDSMGPLYLAIESGCSRSNVDVPDVEVFEVPAKFRLKLRTVIRLDDEHPKGQPSHHVVDGRKLIEALSRSRRRRIWRAMRST